MLFQLLADCWQRNGFKKIRLNSMKFFLNILFLLVLQSSFGQISGTVTDNQGNPLPSASIYIEGTTFGVNSNTNGEYSLNLPSGKSKIIIKYIGFKTQSKTIENQGKQILMNIRLEPQTMDIGEVQITANAEDPAYAIIRNAIAKRAYYLSLIKSYSCDVYIKGNQKILKIPKKILGQDIGTLDGILDTNRQGIVYLSESLSRFHFQAKDKIKEELISSKLSGNSKGFSFNRAREMRFNLYEPYINFGKQIISPISSGALLFYKYKLEGSFYDENGREINKIKVIPRNDSDPVFRGDIFIYENTWNIHSCNLAITSKTINQEILDTMWLKQQYVPGPEKDQWLILSQSIDFDVKFIGIVLKGYFTAVYSNYDVNKTFPTGFFDGEILKINAESNKRDAQYWDSLRPIPLLKEEQSDFVRKDSLEIIWKSKKFRDSTDRKDNRFTSNSLLLGYTYRNSFNRWSLQIGSPLTTIEFDPVRGFYTRLAVKYKKNQDEDANKWYSIEPELNYGFSDKKLRGTLQFQRQFNRINYAKFSLSGGLKLNQYNDEEPISTTVSSLYNLYGKNNYLKSYNKTFVETAWSQRLGTIIQFATSVAFEQREFVDISTNYSFNKNDLSYSTNFPGDTLGNFNTHQAIVLNASFSFSPGSKYVSYPDYRVYLPSKYPVFGINYKFIHTFNFASQPQQSYDLHNPELFVNYKFEPRFLGSTQVKLKAGTSIVSNGTPEIIDFKHFNGNQTFIMSFKGMLNSFRLLPYYDFSTSGNYAEAHINHNFEGFFLGKIPLIKKLKFEENISFNSLIQENNVNYTEYSLGLSNIGWSIFRIFRVDYSWAFLNSKLYRQGITIGISL